MYTSTLLSVLGLAALVSCHVEMTSPVPFGRSTLDNFPLKADGSDFPCKQRPAVYNAEGASNNWPIGSTQSLAFIGTAVHGGGSCQVSVTYDLKPTKDSVWKVIHSIEGGCPQKGVTGNTGNSATAVIPDTYPFTIPSSLPTGTGVVAWTWFNKVGNREMYMNCAPISITGGSGKRSDEDELMERNTTQLMERDTAAYNALPDMFVANIGGPCGTVETTDVIFPNPGDSLVLDGSATSKALSTPTGCAAGYGGSPPSKPTSVGSGSSPSSAASPPKPTASPPGIPGAVFATVAPPSPAPTQPALAPVASGSPPASPAASSASVAAPVASAVAPPPAPVTGASPSTSTPGKGAQVAGSACTVEGMWNCIGGTSFQQCASGTWSVVMQVAAGTTCSTGQSAAINITASGKAKRAIRFSNEHVRRHLHRS